MARGGKKMQGRGVRQFCIDAQVGESLFYHWRGELRMRNLERAQAAEQAATSHEKTPPQSHEHAHAIEQTSAVSVPRVFPLPTSRVVWTGCLAAIWTRTE